ncbi:MAG: exodeoxyribonuclease VII large subunit [Cetobacterium sp.]|uniref:exodeoxyribonuclease VII large subunit n=1 Tax=Cetobacterium sp. TaxID=2071632 RepID=UPI003F30DE15
MEERIYTVSEFNGIVKEFLESNNIFNNFFLKGELSGVTYYKSGHLYFTLKDKKSQIKCAAFNYKYKKIADDLKEGDSVKIFCDVGFYEARGDFQILVRYIEKENTLGEMYQKLEDLKKELEKKGMFSLGNKKQLPAYPKTIGVVTAFTGAAFHDIVKTTRKRYENINIYVYSAKVQGLGAKEEIVKGIETLNNIDEIDLIIAGRGGGSIEDLWAFNEKEVAEAFFNSKKPIISAVGHEIDILLSDLVADKRASTPTQAIEIAIPVKKDIKENILRREKYINRLIDEMIKSKRKDLEKRRNNYIIKSYIKEIERKKEDLFRRESFLEKIITQVINDKKNILENKIHKIISLNPLEVLKRGYSITTFETKIIKNIEELKVGNMIETKLSNGNIRSKVEEIIISEKEDN